MDPVMIASDAEFQQAQDYLRAMEAALAELRAELARRNPERYRLAAQSYAAEIQRTRAEIDDYLGIAEAA